MARRREKDGVVPILQVRKGATLREIYSQLRKDFSAEDLHKYTVIEDEVPAAQVIAEMERIQKEVERKSPKRRKTSRK